MSRSRVFTMQAISKEKVEKMPDPRATTSKTSTMAKGSQRTETCIRNAIAPAVKKNDVQVTYDEGTITIKGERKQQKDEKNEKCHRVESFYGSFERSFTLPDNVNAETIRCESKDGILTMHIPKTETGRRV